jgi:DNA-binding NarL/FixJ family response regulator
MKKRVILAFSNTLFSEGIRKMLDGDGDLSIEILKDESEYPYERLETLKPDVILTDFVTLYNSFPELERNNKKFPCILIDTNCGRENLVTAILKKKISGILLNGSGIELLRKAVRSVANGEVWIDKQTFKSILNGVNSLSGDKMSALSGREREIVGLIGHGFRNKEIAQKLHISEPTVKSHLTRIFQKLNVRSRSELVSYAIKNNDMAPSGLVLAPEQKTSGHLF